MKKKGFDFYVGLFALAVSSHKAYGKGPAELKKLRPKEKEFQQFLALTAKEQIKNQVKDTEQFPTTKPVCLFILQYCASHKAYKAQDVDNMARSILNALKGVVYKEDSQVKTLVMVKNLTDNRITGNFLYIAGKEEKETTNQAFIKKLATQQAFTLFQKLKQHQRL